MADFLYNDGGRSESGYVNSDRDCTVRSIAIATDLNYKVVHKDLSKLNKANSTKIGANSARYANTTMPVIKEYLNSLGWKWIPTMIFGQGCKVHLHKDELPSGRIIARLSKHITCMIDGVINDVSNPQRGALVGVRNGKPFRQSEKRCVYGYWIKEVA